MQLKYKLDIYTDTTESMHQMDHIKINISLCQCVWLWTPVHSTVLGQYMKLLFAQMSLFLWRECVEKQPSAEERTYLVGIKLYTVRSSEG